MNPILCCDWLLEQPRWPYLPCPTLLGTMCCVAQENSVLFPYNINFDQACLVKMTRYLTHSFLDVYEPRQSQGNKHAKKKRTRPISSHLDLMLDQ